MWLTLNDRAIALCDSPSALRFRASVRCAAVSFSGRPMRFVDRARPSAVRVKIISRSTSATPPSTARNSRPVLLVLSAIGCEKGEKVAPRVQHALYDGEEIEHRSCEAINAGNHQLIARSNRLQQAIEFLTVCPSAGDLLFVDKVAARGL